MRWVSWVLEQSWWQGIAGIAQIVAGVLAAYTVIQARKTIRQANEERKFSVRPAWEITRAVPNLGSLDRPVRLIEIELFNSGLGPARKPKAHFDPQNDNQPHRVYARARGSKPRVVVLRRSSLLIDVFWHIARPLDGLLTVACETRFGEQLQSRFHLETWTDEKGVPDGRMTRAE